MKKLLFLFVLMPVFGYAEGPKYRHKEAPLQLEFENVYQDLRGKASSASISTVSVSAQYFYAGSSVTAPVIAVGTVSAPNGTIGIVIQPDGSVNKPNQPSFLAYHSASLTDVTGDGTALTVSFNTEVIDQGADFTNSTFTAPVNGVYELHTRVQLNQLATVTHTAITLKIITSNRTYEYRWANHPSSTLSNLTFPLSTIADMDAGDTAIVTIEVDGSGKTVDVIGTSAQFTSFSGSLIN